ncbi:aminotransferase class I/II-fold pyridoxal phosphate-dependent enzyme [Candidatus Gottesmanbacteria bacterium]|nr:aminotransferase class I/II-fold pyridoxal phosphate-dependent enzyme [Candidatus Gottesmanbacteria bacterium]
MKLKPFKLERFFAKYEFTAKYLLCCSDCDGLSQNELLSMADREDRKLWGNLKLGYTDTRGHLLLRQEIVKLYDFVTPDDVLVVVPGEGIFLAINALLNSGDHVICTFPGYQSLYEIAEGIGCEITKWEPDEDAGWRFDPEFLVKHIKPNTKLIIINFPHNPTGFLPSKKDYDQIINIAKEHSLYIFSDEMYRFLEYDAEDRLPNAADVYDKAVSLSGLSKSYGLAGLRIGWIVTKDTEVYKKIYSLKDYTTICSSAPSEILAIIGLRAKERIIKAKLEVILKNLSLLDGFFKEYSHLFSWIRPKAGTVAFPRINRDIDSYDFCEKMVKEASIMLLPSSVYDYDHKHFRLGFGRENMPEVLEKFKQYISKLQ